MNNCIRKNRGVFILLCIIIIAYDAVFAYTSLLTMDILENLIELNFHKILITGIKLLICWGFVLIANYYVQITSARAIKCFNNTMRADMTEVLNKANYKQFMNKNMAQYLSWYTNDINQIENLVWNTMFNQIHVVAQFVFSAAMLIYVHWSLGLIAMVLSAIILIGPKLCEKKVINVSEKFANDQEKFTDAVKNNIYGLNLFTLSGKKLIFVKNMKKISNDIELSKYNLAKAQATNNSIIMSLNVFSQISILFSMIGLIVFKIVPIKVISGGGSLASNVTNSFSEYAYGRVVIKSGKAFFDKLEAFKKELVCETAKDNNPCTMSIKKEIKLESINFSYNDKMVLNNFSHKFESGKKYAITGASGKGKSTILKILFGFLTDYNGQIYIDNTAVLKEEVLNIMVKNSAYIEQNPYMFNDTITYNITLGEDIPEKDITNALTLCQFEMDDINFPDGLNTIVGEDGSKLSGGQKQKIAIARALISKKKILIIDEGTSAIDYDSSSAIESQLLNNTDITLIFVSHNLMYPDRYDEIIQLN